MQIEKHIKIIPTPTGAVVFFAGQVCLSVNEHSGRYTWSISPVFAKLTTGVANCFQVPMASWDGQETLAEAIADGLTKLDEMQAFYGVIDMPEDTYVGEHLNESYKELDEAMVDGWTAVRSAAGHTFHVKASHDSKKTTKFSVHKDKNSDAIESGKYNKRMLVNRIKTGDYDHLIEEVDEGTDYSGIEADVKRTGKSHERLAAEHRAYAKQMRAIGKDGLAVRSEMLANDHEKAYLKTSKKTDESIEDEDLLVESFVVRQVGQSRNYPPRIMISAAAVINRAREMAKEAGEKSHAKFIKLAHTDIASNMKAESEEIEGDQINEINKHSFVGRILRHQELKKKVDNSWKDSVDAHSRGDKESENRNFEKHVRYTNLERPGTWTKVKEEFIQYEDALPAVFQAIKEDCRVEALAMSDSLLEAQQLANELFEDIVEEYLNELSKGTLGSYVVKAAKDAVTKTLSNDEDDFNKGQKRIHLGIPKATKKLTKEEVEEIDEGKILDVEAKIKAHDASKTSNMSPADLFSHENIRKQLLVKRKAAQRDYNKKLNNEEVEELDEASSLYKKAIDLYSFRTAVDYMNGGDEHMYKANKFDHELHGVSKNKAAADYEKMFNKHVKKMNEEVEEIDEATHQELLDGAQKAYVEATRKGNGVMARHYGQEILKHKAIIAKSKKSKLKEEVEEIYEFEGVPYTLGGKVDKNKVYKVHRASPHGNHEMEHNPLDVYHSLDDAKRVAKNMGHAVRGGSKTKITIHNRTKLAGPVGKLPESFELDEAALSGDAYWKAKEAESKEEFLKSQRKALGLPEPVKRGRGKPTLIDRDSLKSRAHSNVEAGKRPTAGFDRNEKIHFVRHLKNHPDFADKHVSQAGRPTGTTKVAKQQQELVKKKQDTAFSMWAGLGKR